MSTIAISAFGTKRTLGTKPELALSFDQLISSQLEITTNRKSE
jgi:hypothetical protein